MSALRPVPVLALVVLLALPVVATPAAAQGRMVPPPAKDAREATAVPASRYQAGSAHRMLLGSDWRDLWATPIPLPVLHIDTFAGGLTPEREGGNRQSVTLHFLDASGTGWVFRSLDKYPSEKLGVGGLVEWVIQDQVSAMLPGGELVLPPLLDALGILHVEPRLYVLPDDALLGEFRERFAGMIGALELKPDEGEGDTPGFAGARKNVSAENMLDRLEDSPIHRVHERELLRARLLDFIVGDTDRTLDQWRFARFPDPESSGRYVWRPIPRDRDFAFHSADGFLVGLVFSAIYPKFAKYEREHASLESNTYSSHQVDRKLLTGLTREDFEAEVALVRQRLTDDVIARAVGRLPASYPADDRARLATTLAARRDGLRGIGMEFYAWLASDVDVRATDHGDRADIERHPDGSVQVTLAPRPESVEADYDGDEDEAPAATTEPYYRRVFLPGETGEVRIYLHGGDDVAVVRGGSGAIRIRVIGGGGDDVLADSSGAGRVHLYDHRGDNRFVRSHGTAVDTRDWDAPDAPEGVRIGTDWAPDWGAASRSWAPALDFGEYAGVIIGVGPAWTRYGFRRLPYHWKATVRPLFALAALRFGVEAGLDYRPENSLNSLELGGRWVDFDAIRWFGPGNDSEPVARDLSLVPMARGRLDVSWVLRFGAWRSEAEEGTDGTDALSASTSAPAPLRGAVSLGPVVAHTDPRPRTGGPYALDPAATASPGWEAGGRIALDLGRADRATVPRRGFRLRAEAEAYPVVTGGGASFGSAATEVNAYIPVPGPAHLALRAGGRQALGDYPAWHAASIGGRTTLRGFEYQRFSGDRSVYGGAELRVPVARLALLADGELGVFGLVDTGRVWFDGASPGGWHTGYGGGLWYATLGRAVSIAYATGEREQLYLSLGLFY